ncbi:aminotransferase class III-fold pyridoxal phosphate-dependent enzyme [Prochlorococcus marinus]|uniref:aminotransferase class III-fold pyridoxal phosphate-dependent enzyme n=1 Tax=Prochlorococcus marinus TaxID=1219 RepID=UPI0018D3B1AB|nr:aminotransferase class III-fold pyridoxal phosphate-dependent enzyme [Prochlorococcus marinus]
MLEEALNLIPLASQTFSKSVSQLPRGVSPLFVDRADGARFWDVDGHSFIDLTNGLACVTLGYRHPAVDEAVRSQLQSGVSFSLPHKLELQVAKLIIEMVPCAEMVRFAKNGTDATSGAIRLARHCTKRDRIALCGYHGWQDWSIGTTSRNGGVPKGVSDLSHTFIYNDIDSLKNLLNRYPDEFAAVILEPMNITWPEPGFLETIKSIAHQHGALLIFDETITGFRFSNGGAQELFGVIPDLSTFGKGLANGFPLSALVGRSSFMKEISNIFFSGTFGGETLSLAAANAVLLQLLNNNVTDKLSSIGSQIADGVNHLINHYSLSHVFSLSGHPSWKIWSINDHYDATAWEIRTFLFQELYARGMFTIGSHNISLAHLDFVDEILDTYSQVLSLLSSSLTTKGGVRHSLRCKPIEPLFRVR